MISRQLQLRQRRHFRRFEHHAAAGGQGRGEFPGGGHHGEIPRHDQPHHAAGFAAQAGAEVIGGQRHRAVLPGVQVLGETARSTRRWRSRRPHRCPPQTAVCRCCSTACASTASRCSRTPWATLRNRAPRSRPVLFDQPANAATGGVDRLGHGSGHVPYADLGQAGFPRWPG